MTLLDWERFERNYGETIDEHRCETCGVVEVSHRCPHEEPDDDAA